MIRIELSVSGAFVFGANNSSSFYRAVTAHGVGMVFLFIMPALISALGNWTIPHSYCGLDFATPRLNNMAFWTSMIAVYVVVVAISHSDGLAAGWTLYYPLTGIDFSSSSAVSIAVLFACIRLVIRIRSNDFLVSIQMSKSSGINVLEYCLISWAIVTISVLLITTLPVLAAGITLLLGERHCTMPSLLGNFWTHLIL